MQSIRNVMLSMLLGAFLVVSPATHSADAKTHHVKHTNKVHSRKVVHTKAAHKTVTHKTVRHKTLTHRTSHMKVVHRTALRSGTMIVPARTRSARALQTTTSTAYVPSTNKYDNGHANVINKVREKWSNARHNVAYDTYRLSHGGATSAAEQRQDAAREAQDRAHEAQDRANTGRSQ